MKYVNKLTLLTLVVLLLLPLAVVLHATGLANLRCEHLANPLGVDVTQPRLGWVMNLPSAVSGRRRIRFWSLRRRNFLVVIREICGTVARWHRIKAFRWNIRASRWCRGYGVTGRCASGTRMAKPRLGPSQHCGRWDCCNLPIRRRNGLAWMNRQIPVCLLGRNGSGFQRAIPPPARRPACVIFGGRCRCRQGASQWPQPATSRRTMLLN